MIMKHKIDVPEGCKVVSVETTDDMVVVKFEKEVPNTLEQEPNIRKEELGFNENEILFCKNSETKWVAIFDKCKDKHSFYAYKSGNYFPTREMAEAFQKVYIESLNNFHKNL